MADAMCSDSTVGSCSIVDWTSYSISSGNIGSQASFNTELPVACGSQCNADANSACATSCSTCDGQEISGADTPVTRRYKMGTMAAKNITFSFETYEIKDRITVSYEGRNLFDSGCVRTEGEKYLPISFEDYYNKFTAAGQAFIDCVRPRLFGYLENYLSEINGAVNCDDLYIKALDSHEQIYADCNFCDMVFSNLSALMEVLYDANACEQIRNMVVKCSDVYYREFCDKYPDTPCICTSS
ncbi:hypothetical protein WR25_17616 [Diploscapter pachys]|uniref:Uncharacterized protein n=1 Tax=Diploscapter pachys TaxID=2018661 RepID=A0A2A2KMN8_9BILA|nr:hypothetical protein WR25_17616 [Diploscapter pachys]